MVLGLGFASPVGLQWRGACSGGGPAVEGGLQWRGIDGTI